MMVQVKSTNLTFVKHWYKTISLVVVENLWDKSPHSNIFSFSESVHPLVPQKKSLNELLLGKKF